MNEAVVVALIGLIGGVLTNIDRIYPVVLQILGIKTEASPLAGEWTGLFKEYRGKTKQEEISEEIVALRVRSHQVKGVVTATREHRRHRKVSGGFQHDFLILSYFVAEKKRVGAATMILRGKPEGESPLLGYWLGYDPELDRIVSAPYVLTRDTQISRAKEEHHEWLSQPCQYLKP